MDAVCFNRFLVCRLRPTVTLSSHWPVLLVKQNAMPCLHVLTVPYLWCFAAIEPSTAALQRRIQMILFGACAALVQPLENFEVPRFNELLAWLGLAGCKYTRLAQENLHSSFRGVDVHGLRGECTASNTSNHPH